MEFTYFSRVILRDKTEFIFLVTVDCPIDEVPNYQCAVADLPSQENFDADKVRIYTDKS